jgi:hypothetical protein
MPNWCDNKLSIDGDEKLIKKFYDENKDDDEDEELSFNKSVPLYDDDDDDDYEYDGDGDDNMKRITMWGTKWDAHEVCTDKMGDYEFQTAWSPPIPWFVEVVEKYPELSFELLYSEQGMGFSGVIKGKAREIYMNEIGYYGEYHGLIFCEYCDGEFTDDEICTEYRDNICYECLEQKKDIITDCIINIKKKRLPFKNACNRISRNPIFDHYLMKKVFVKRIEEIL